MKTVVATILKVGERGATGDFITRTALEDALKRKPVEGVRRLWIEDDELKAEVEVTDDSKLAALFGGRW